MLYKLILQTFRTYDWVIITVGTAGSSAQNHPRFTEQPGIESSVVIYNVDVRYSKICSTFAENFAIFEVPYCDSQTEQETREIGMDFGQLITHLITANKKIVLMFGNLPSIPSAFIKAANQNKSHLGTSLFVTGSFPGNEITIIYNPLFLIEWCENQLKSNISWIQSAPAEQKLFDELTSTSAGGYYSMEKNDPARTALLRHINQKCYFMGQIYRQISEIKAEYFSGRTHPRLSNQAFLKLFRQVKRLEIPNASHYIYKGFKEDPVKKGISDKSQIFKTMKHRMRPTTMTNNLVESFIEVLGGDFYRLILAGDQPKTRFAYSPVIDEYGTLSREIPNFISLAAASSLNEEKKSDCFDNIKAKLEQVGLIRMLLVCVWLGEFDLNMSNAGTDSPAGSFIYKIDHACCLPKIWSKYVEPEPSSEEERGIWVESFRITKEIIEALPHPGLYPAFNWFGLIQQGHSKDKCSFLDAATIKRVTDSPSRQKDLHTTMCQILVLNDEFIKAFTGSYLLQFLNVQDRDHNYNAVMDQVAIEAREELIDRRLQMQQVAFQDPSFIEFLKSEKANEVCDTFRQRILKFTLFKKIKVSADISTPEELMQLFAAWEPKPDRLSKINLAGESKQEPPLPPDRPFFNGSSVAQTFSGTHLPSPSG